MKLLQPLNEAMHYIEENLHQSIDLKEVAKQALSSEYQFKRIFSFLSGMTLSEYIRKRRMTLAAMDLQKEEIKVIDLANRYNYSSPDSFSRAFESFHGVLPSDVGRSPHTVKSCPKLSFRLTIEGGVEMKYRIEEKQAFQVVGIKKQLTMEDGELNPSYDEVIAELTDDLMEELIELSDTEPEGVIHVTTDYSETTQHQETFNHYIGAAVQSSYSGKKETKIVPASTWAVFEMEGDWESIEEEWTRIYSEWLPSSNYELVKGAEILASKDNHSEVWIQVKKK